MRIKTSVLLLLWILESVDVRIKIQDAEKKHTNKESHEPILDKAMNTQFGLSDISLSLKLPKIESIGMVRL